MSNGIYQATINGKTATIRYRAKSTVLEVEISIPGEDRPYKSDIPVRMRRKQPLTENEFLAATFQAAANHGLRFEAATFRLKSIRPR
jgi:hypothetical protein